MATIYRLRATPAERARSLRGLARERHELAVRKLVSGDRDAFLAYLRDVDALEDYARLHEERAQRIKRGLRERAQTVRAIDSILAKAEEDAC